MTERLPLQEILNRINAALRNQVTPEELSEVVRDLLEEYGGSQPGQGGWSGAGTGSRWEQFLESGSDIDLLKALGA